jgi:hypothetical protein
MFSFGAHAFPLLGDHTPLFMERQERVKSKDEELCQKCFSGLLLMRKKYMFFAMFEY